MSHSFSKSWKAPAVVAKEQWTRVLKSRDHLCPDSPFLPRAFDTATQRIIMDAAWTDLLASKTASTTQDSAVRADDAIRRGRTLDSLGPFQDRVLSDPSRGMVLSESTIWTPKAEQVRPFTAPWPSIAEMKYEGDERVATSLDHGRFLPVPRYPSDIPGMAWSELAFLPQEHFDEVLRVDEEAVFFANHEVVELEVGDEEGEHLLGRALMDLLDSKHVLGVEESEEKRRAREEAAGKDKVGRAV
ncbi:hypothetical protein BDZ85DRAFT_315689 [Elsinoe ampelina]|uniref:Uncharacterized protein n=1 Tax=Elsinoe ampelina TaxID=302913 RepID=A0A6A6GR86_9PEZI|nr:hypothetical protein BDZ85DRAFT_315689 [Elsinoe ampelina]